MNQKKITDAESIASANNKCNLKLPFIRRARHHSETNDLRFNAYNDLMNFDNLDVDHSNAGFIDDRLNLNNLAKLGSSAPNDSWYFSDPNYAHDTDKSPIINSDCSEPSDEDEKSSLASFKKSANSFKLKFGRQSKKQPDPSSYKKSNFLQLPRPSSLLSSSTGSIDLSTPSNQTTKRSKKSAKNSVRKRKRCYSMDERRNLRTDLNVPFSFDNLAYNKENLSDISEPLSSSERSNEELNAKCRKTMMNYQTMNDSTDHQLKKLPQAPIILINSKHEYDSKVKFDLNGSGDDEDKDEDKDDDKNEDKDYLIDEFKSSQIDIELGSNESNEDLSDKASTNEIEFTTKLASDLAKAEIETESLLAFMFQVLFPLLVCGLGNLCAGLLLHKIESYEVFREINELYIAVPCLMGLKGRRFECEILRTVLSNFLLFSHYFHKIHDHTIQKQR